MDIDKVAFTGSTEVQAANLCLSLKGIEIET
jgi:hypothetical protein